MSTYLSIDVATKSLAIGIYKINNQIELTEENVDNKIEIIFTNVYDLGEGKNAKDILLNDKAIALKKYLDEVDLHLNTEYTVLIEYQMNANHMSNAVFNMIVYHYAHKANIHVIKPSLKNSIYTNSDLKLSEFLATANTNYAANKNHCKYNFLYFVVLFDHIDKIKHIKNKNLDDIADTFMQCLAFYKSQKNK